MIHTIHRIMQYRMENGVMWVECEPKSFMTQAQDLSNIHHFDEAFTMTAAPRAPHDSKQATNDPSMDLRFPLSIRRLYREESKKIADALASINAAAKTEFKFDYDWFTQYQAVQKGAKFSSACERFPAYVRDYYVEVAKGIVPIIADEYSLESLLENVPTRNIRLTHEGNDDQHGLVQFRVIKGELHCQYYVENFSQRASDFANPHALERALDKMVYPADAKVNPDPKLNKRCPLTVRKAFRDMEPKKLKAEEDMKNSSGLPFKFVIDAGSLYHDKLTHHITSGIFVSQLVCMYCVLVLVSRV